MEEKKYSVGYKPRPLQLLLHKRLRRFNVLVCHRRFGKTIFCINHMLDRAMKNKRRNPQYAYIAPTYKQAKRIAWDPIIEYARKVPGFKVNKQDLTIIIERYWLEDPDTIKILLLGSDDPDTLRGLYLDGAIFDEFAQCDPIVWGEVVRPALSDRLGWAIFIGTPKGPNHFKDRYDKALVDPRWFTCVFKASETQVIPQEELEAMEAEMDEEEYAQELECDFQAAVKGAYYSHIINAIEEKGQIGDFPYDPLFPVDTYWDLGMHDAVAIWFRQRMRGGEFRYVDYYETNGTSIPEIAKVLKEKDYAYGRHVLPWDANTRELGTGKTRLEVARAHLRGVEIQKRQSIADRIQASRVTIKKSFFNRDTTNPGLKALISFQKEWDAKNQIFKDHPKKDWSNHGADSYGYSALDERESFFQDYRREDLPRMAESDYNELGDY